MRLSLKNLSTRDTWILDVPQDASIQQLHNIIISTTCIQHFELKSGYPPSGLSGLNMEDAGIRHGDQILIFPLAIGNKLNHGNNVDNGNKLNDGRMGIGNMDNGNILNDGKMGNGNMDNGKMDGVLVVREMKDDNSCLFRSIAYVLERNVDKHVALRSVVADYILDHPQEYPQVVLGREPIEYSSWIRNLNSWGGAIELSVFSEIYKTEIDSIDISTLRVDRFGQDRYDSRVVVLYSGIHYDVIALSPSFEAPKDFDVTCFSTLESQYLDGALELARKLKKEHKYTDLANFTLKCGICFKGLKGQVEAQKHAMSTGHDKFTEFQ